MNPYEVIWPPETRDRVIEFLAAALSPSGREVAEINRALGEIEETLQSLPLYAGESRMGDSRVLVVLPLSVHFRVVQTEREVLVQRIE